MARFSIVPSTGGPNLNVSVCSGHPPLLGQLDSLRHYRLHEPKADRDDYDRCNASFTLTWTLVIRNHTHPTVISSTGDCTERRRLNLTYQVLPPPPQPELKPGRYRTEGCERVWSAEEPAFSAAQIEGCPSPL